MFSNLYWLELHNITRVALANLWYNISKNWFEIEILLVSLSILEAHVC